ncbi:hypothetical protein MTBLM1_80225 [Rhodospirillaceae bacterium LM-1]|nr:hypothetical protein MTBLM1_80225 [Rhodospirillaceae bacterium LM-1]
MHEAAERLLAIIRQIRDDVAEMSAKGLRLAETMPGNDDLGKIFFDLQFYFLFLMTAGGAGSPAKIDLYNLTFGTRLTLERLASELKSREEQIASYGNQPSHLIRAGFMVDAAFKNSHCGDRMIQHFQKLAEIFLAAAGNDDPNERKRLDQYIALAREWQTRAAASFPAEPNATPTSASPPLQTGRKVFGRKGA